MGIVFVHVFHHFFRSLDAWFRVFGIRVFTIRQVFHPCFVAHFVDVTRIHELHGIPVGVASPILPVLHDAVQWYAEFTVFVQHFAEFIRAFVAFTALPVPHSPKRKHGGLAGEIAYAGNDTVLRTVFINKVIVAHVAHLAIETCFLRGVGEHSGRRVVPIDAITFF